MVLREAAFECLVKIAALYYDTLPAYMEAIFTLTQRAVSTDEEDVAKQAIEFWCSICEEEIDLIEVRLLQCCGWRGFATGSTVEQSPQPLGCRHTHASAITLLKSWPRRFDHPD